MARAGVHKEDSVARLRDALAEWVLREVKFHAESQPDSPVRSDVVAAVQNAVEAAIDAKIQAFGEARTALIAEELRQEVLSAFEALDGVFHARLDVMEEAWREAAEKHLAAAETSIQKAVLERYESRLNKLVTEHTRRLEAALRKATADVQHGRQSGPDLVLDPSYALAPDDGVADSNARPAPRRSGGVTDWRAVFSWHLPRWVVAALIVAAVALIGGLAWRCSPWLAPAQTRPQPEVATDAREDAAEELRRRAAEAEARGVDEAVDADATPEDERAASGDWGGQDGAERIGTEMGTPP